MSFIQPQCVWPIETMLGEGPLWVPAERALWFVDIKQNHIHRSIRPAGQKTYETPEACFIVAGGEFIVGMTSGLYRFHPQRFTLMMRVDADKPGNRLNDGALDAQGRLWFGPWTMARRRKRAASIATTRAGSS